MTRALHLDVVAVGDNDAVAEAELVTEDAVEQPRVRVARLAVDRVVRRHRALAARLAK